MPLYGYFSISFLIKKVIKRTLHFGDPVSLSLLYRL